MAKKQIKEAVEFTTFRINVSFEAFVTANKDVDEFLKQQPGFKSRKMIQLDNGTVVDILIWDSVEEGTNAMHGLMSELADSPVHAVIRQSTVSWNIAPVLHGI